MDNTPTIWVHGFGDISVVILSWWILYIWVWSPGFCISTEGLHIYIVCYPLRYLAITRRARHFLVSFVFFGYFCRRLTLWNTFDVVILTDTNVQSDQIAPVVRSGSTSQSVPLSHRPFSCRPSLYIILGEGRVIELDYVWCRSNGSNDTHIFQNYVFIMVWYSTCFCQWS